MTDEMSAETRDWYMRLARLQKTSDEMDEDQRESADWQDGYDCMVRTARVQADEIERLQMAINSIAPWLSASLSDPKACAEYRADDD